MFMHIIESMCWNEPISRSLVAIGRKDNMDQVRRKIRDVSKNFFTHAHLSHCRTWQLGKIISVLGTLDFIRFMKKYRLVMTPQIQHVLDKYVAKGRRKRRSLVSFMEPGCPMPSRAGLRLIESLLVYDPRRRLTAHQAMRHAFFDEVRQRVFADLEQRKLLSPSLMPSTLQTPSTLSNASHLFGLL